MTAPSMSWFSIVRMGLVQTALGAIVVLTTSTINRVMVVELALPAMIPGVLVALHYALQSLRPRWGHGSDVGGRRTPWIVGGMAVLGIGGVGAAVATAVIASNFAAGFAIAVVAFTMVGIGVGATGTNLLAMLATHVAAERRAAAATIVWMMMIAGFIVTTITVGSFLDPFSTTRLVAVTSAVSAIAFLIATAALYKLEDARLDQRAAAQPADEAAAPFRQSLSQVWEEPQARRFAIFIFVSMLAYSMQDLILEPFAGIVFNLTPGQTTKLSGLQNGGVFCGMLLVALAANPRVGFGSLKVWTVAGCFGSAVALLALVASGITTDIAAMRIAVVGLGVANGAYAVAAIGSMMALAASGRRKREGMRMGIFGAAQALSFGAGGFLGTVAVDVIRRFVEMPGTAYAAVFFFEALLFVVSAVLAVRATETRHAAELEVPGSREDGELTPAMPR
ncbi:MAG: BCD family MFS transporter [Hyphomicrobium sp.]|nr:BCD family MFS transporter [Hyphomicrobium sp.]